MPGAETALSRSIKQALELRGAKVIRIQSGVLPVQYGNRTHRVHCAPKGTPDLLVIRERLASRGNELSNEAIYTHLEVKSIKGKLGEEQRKWQEWADASGVRSFVVRSVSEAIKAVFGG